MSKFYKIFLSVAGGLLALILIGCIGLTFVLKDYESAQPDRIAEACFLAAAEQGDFASLRPAGTESFETADAINTACAERVKGQQVNMLKGVKGSDDSVPYILKVGDEKLLTFTLVKADKKSKFGFTTYEIGKVNFHFAKDITVKAPADCTVSVNGVPVGEQYLSGDAEVDEMLPMPDGLKPIPVLTYTVADILSEPTITAVGSEGDNRLISYHRGGNYYQVGGEQNAELAEQYGNYVVEATEKYATWMADDGYFGMVAAYFEPNTETYRYIRETEVSFVWDHDRYDFSDAKATDFCQYSDTVFTCRVQVTQNLYLAGQEPYHDYIDLTLCMHKVDGKYLVYSLKSNA